jgi:DNA repair exonuclease SbcCD ATPase subunit
MPQATTISRPVQDPTTTQLKELRAHANELKLRASDLEVRKTQLGQQRAALGADVSPAARQPLDKAELALVHSATHGLDKQLTDVQHELSSTYIQLESTNQEIHDVEMARDMSRVGVTVQPPPLPGYDPVFKRQEMVLAGTFVLLLPLVFAFARRIWRRASVPAMDLENSPRLQRIEQAIESIAVEVERIGEAQRFTTKLLADRQPDAVARIAVMPRKEPGTITPH